MQHETNRPPASSGALKDPVYWSTSEFVRQEAVTGMANRASFELDQVGEGVDIGKAHGETAGRYRQYEQLYLGARRFLRKAGLPMRGQAADLGSGTGVAACILSRFDTIDRVWAVEISEPFVRDVMPVVFNENQARQEKIQRVVGDFSRLEVADNSLGVIAEIDSFHHSESLNVTLKECWRALRPGGVIAAIDRAWPDHTTQAQLDAMLDKEFPDHMKTKYNIPLSDRFTRRDWGEHEYTLRQWLEAFSQAGFDAAALRQYHPPALNSLLLKLPTFNLSIDQAALGYRLGGRKLWIYGFAPTRVTFIAVKR
jgi:SAM-dependent methyltransferase